MSKKNKKRIDSYKVISLASFAGLAVFTFIIFFFIYKAFSNAFMQNNVTKASEEPIIEDEKLKQAVQIAEEWKNQEQVPTTAVIQEPPKQEELALRILNGTQTEGLGALVADILREEGFTNIVSIANADKNDYNTTVFRSKNTALLYLNMVVEALGLSHEDVTLENLPNEEEFDMVIIIGQDLSSAR